MSPRNDWWIRRIDPHEIVKPKGEMDMFNATDLLNPSASKVFFWLRFSRTIDNTSVTRQDSMPNPGPQADRSAVPAQAASASPQFVKGDFKHVTSKTSRVARARRLAFWPLHR